MKYRIKTNQLPIEKGTIINSERECCSGIHYDTFEAEWYSNPQYLSRNPQWFEPVKEVEEGQYWKDGNIIYRITGESNMPSHDWETIPVNYTGCDRTHFSSERLLEKATLLSDKQVEQVLIEEANKRFGRKKIKINDIEGSANYVIIKPSYETEYYDTDVLVYNGGAVYKQGGWAEIIEDSWKVDCIPYRTITDGETIITTLTTEDITEQQANAIAKALNDLED